MPPNALIDLITALWLGFIGACIGSFLNVVAYRMPLGMSVIWKPSHCPKCNHAIRPYDNVPIFGWLWLKGKCRDCGEPISPRYAIVEFVMGLAFFVLAYAELFSGGANLPGGPITEFTGAVNNFLVPHWPLIGVYAYHGVLLSLLMVITLVDLDGKKVPFSFVVFGGLVGLLTGMLGVHPWLQKEWFRTEGLEIASAFGFALFGAACGFLASAVIIAVWRVRLETAQNIADPNKEFFCERTGIPFNKAGNLIAAMTLAGTFLGGLVLWYAVLCTVVMLVFTRGILPKKCWGLCKLALPVFFCVLIVLIAFGKPMQSYSPM